MEWKKIAPWNWFKEEESSHPARPAHTSSLSVPDSFSSLRNEIDRIFEDTSRQFFTGMNSPFDLPQSIATPIRPSVDISEGRKAYKVRAEIPGVDQEDVSLEVEGQTLVIRAEKRQDREEDDEDEGYHWVERSYGAVQRVLSLPEDADVEAIDARFKNGVLKLRIPKHTSPPVHGRRIEIQGG